MKNPFRYLRFKVFRIIRDRGGNWMRRKRMARFERFLESLPGGQLRIIDLGGNAKIWQHVSSNRIAQITILNLPDAPQYEPQAGFNFQLVHGDACSLGQYQDGEFDVSFSNSVIEHVGDESRQEAFASEAKRVAKYHWIQTPCKYFPLEVHNGMPFWWFYPESVKRYFIQRWRQKLPAWTEMIEGTRVLEYKQLRRLFPESRIMIERWLLFPKAYIVKKGDSKAA